MWDYRGAMLASLGGRCAAPGLAAVRWGQRLEGAMGVIGPMGPIGGAASQRVGARWWRCVAALDGDGGAVALREQRGEHPEVGATDHNPVQRQLCREWHLPSGVRAEGTLL